MLTLLITIGIVHILAMMSPGPDFFFISHIAASRGRSEAIKATFGVTLAVAIWTTFALLGLDLVLKKLVWLHQTMMIGGGLYLLWLGFHLLCSARQQFRQSENPHQTELSSLQQVRPNSFIRGLMTNLSNPKSIIYFASIFSLFIKPDVSSGIRVALFSMIMIETFLWFTLVAILFSNKKVRLRYQQFSKWVEGCAGTLFVGYGIHLLFTRL